MIRVIGRVLVGRRFLLLLLGAETLTLTGMRAHVPLEQTGPIEGLAADLAGQQRPFAALRSRFRRGARHTGDGGVVQIAGAAGRRRRGGRLAGDGFVLVLGARWRGDGQHDARQQRHGQIERGFCAWGRREGDQTKRVVKMCVSVFANGGRGC